jgi:hypothetical protein
LVGSELDQGRSDVLFEVSDRRGAGDRQQNGCVTERAKGTLMERQPQARRVAAAVVDGHRLLPKKPDIPKTAH